MSLLPRGRECNAKKWEPMARQPPWRRGGRLQRARQTHEREGAWEIAGHADTMTVRWGVGEFADECRTTGSSRRQEQASTERGKRRVQAGGKGSRGKVHVTTGRSFPIPCPALPSMPLVVRSSARLACVLPVRRVNNPREPPPRRATAALRSRSAPSSPLGPHPLSDHHYHRYPLPCPQSQYAVRRPLGALPGSTRFRSFAQSTNHYVGSACERLRCNTCASLAGRGARMCVHVCVKVCACPSILLLIVISSHLERLPPGQVVLLRSLSVTSSGPEPDPTFAVCGSRPVALLAAPGLGLSTTGC
ncbi:hypothetical protein PSV09DRAFT_2258029 [Bipolaris maydis]|uniref:uncharacterized protein n=1 Tax=Cochliobolus heterostrophus TaxID=5016 RepID=UPI0024DA8066|nr:hypothetical protein J3E73DRAFT_257110 [Bipolaris maydis]KAJ5059543.1 hypothetical protein J3E74DRAFT_291208 [Bipolaris maydis]KAJ6209534.1 hypothetical protein PSV09DRAFT_2258029 [Bipolaris maydis]KAJ6271474.1 hypothetical protein PSV08DRAFT_246967 [Bipolaris maydis]